MNTYREGTIDDLPSILSIENQEILNGVALFDVEPKTIEEKVIWFEQFKDCNTLIVVDVDGKMAGYAYVLPYHQKLAYQYTAQLSIYIDPTYQGKGIGKELLKQCLQKSEEVGYNTVLSLITSENEKSIKLHEKFGFKLVGTMKKVGFKFDRWLDVSIYQWFSSANF
ncbi:N-acetyltransferase family protein [Bacillaceae bacterium S4-13-58]